jgi:hypothetical protein
MDIINLLRKAMGAAGILQTRAGLSIADQLVPFSVLLQVRPVSAGAVTLCPFFGC